MSCSEPRAILGLISEQNLFNWNFHWIGIGEPSGLNIHCFWEFRRSAYRQIDVCVHSSFPSTSCDSVFSLHLFLIPMYSTCSHARYPSPWSSSSRHVTEYSFRMVCSLWAFSCFRPVILICGMAVCRVIVVLMKTITIEENVIRIHESNHERRDTR